MTAPIRVADGRREPALLAAVEARAFDAPWSAEALASLARLDGARVLVAEDAGAAVGYALFLVAGDEAELLRLAVVPEARRRGLGTRLLGRGLEQLERAGVAACHLEVRADNEAALALYRRRGFRVVGRRRRYYPDGTDALLLRRTPPRRSSSC